MTEKAEVPASHAVETTAPEANPQSAQTPPQPVASQPPTESAEPAIVHTPLLPGPAGEVPTYDSGRHRMLFNRVAEQLFPFRWVKDGGSPHQVDVGTDDLWLPEALRPSFGMSAAVVEETPVLHSAIRSVEQELDRRRREALTELLAAQQPVNFRFNLSTLSPAAREAARYLIEAAYYIQALYQLQITPEAPTIIRQVYERADPLELTILQRNGVPICGRLSHHDFCDLLPTFPTGPAGSLLWPSGMDEATLATLKQGMQGTTDPRFSPYTAVTRNTDGSLGWLPYARVEAFAPLLQKIAALLERAAAVPGVDATLQQQLIAQAVAFRAGDAYPYHESDTVWTKTQGELELTIGPYETYEDPWDVKAFFECVLGKERAESAALVSRLVPRLTVWEGGVAALLGANRYPVRPMPEQLPFRVIDVIVATGDANADGGPPVAYHLPNEGPVVDAGRGKRVILANHLEAKFQTFREAIPLILAPALVPAVDLSASVRNVILHEIFHGIGPRGSQPIVLPDGTAGTTTVNLALGDFASPLEEAKADVGGQWALQDLAAQGIITPEELRSSYVSKVAGLIRQMRLGRHEAHARGAVMQFGYLWGKGAIVVEGDRLGIDFAKLPQAYTDLLGEIVRAQLAGDANAAKALLTGYAEKLPPIVDQIIARIRAAKIPDGIAVSYTILDE